MDHETWIITPITWTSILVVIGLPVLAILAGIDGVLGFIHNYMEIICYIILAVSAVLLIIPLFSGIHLASLLAFFAGMLPISQLLYMLCNGTEIIYNMPDDVFTFLWRLIVFLIWFIYILINLIVSLGCLVLGSLGSYGYKSDRSTSSDTSALWTDLGLSGGLSAIVGILGWVINWMFL